jgi:hypothetical protein
MSKKTVLGIVHTQDKASHVVNTLVRAGFQASDISVLFPGAGDSRDFALEKGTKAPEGAVAGGGTGGVVGGALGLLAGLGALAIPGVGPLIAAGPIVAALSGIAVGAAVGSIAGALIGLGIPEIEARIYEEKITAGNVLVAVHTETKEHVDTAKRVFEENSVEDVVTTSEVSVPKKNVA